MADDKILNEDLTDMETTLSALRPRVVGSGVDRDRLMFLAGQMSIKAAPAANPVRGWLWPAATAVSTLVAATLGFLLGGQTETLRPAPIGAHAQPGPLPADAVRTTQKTPVAVESVPDDQPSFPEPEKTTFESGLFDSSRNIRLRQIALVMGVDALPLPRTTGSATAEPARTYREERERYLGGMGLRRVGGESGVSETERLFWPFLPNTGEKS